VSKLLWTYVAFTNAKYRLLGEKGQTMAEYGVILAVITIGILAALGFLSGEIQNALKAVANRLDGTEGGTAGS
jgi:Flp pilus assembly pilin Flp